MLLDLDLAVGRPDDYRQPLHHWHHTHPPPADAQVSGTGPSTHSTLYGEGDADGTED